MPRALNSSLLVLSSTLAPLFCSLYYENQKAADHISQAFSTSEFWLCFANECIEKRVDGRRKRDDIWLQQECASHV